MRLLEQTITELRTQLSAQTASSRTTRERVAELEREIAGARGSRRPSSRVPAVRAEARVVSPESYQRDLDARTTERDEARAAVSARESEAGALRAERDEAQAALRAVERERNDARSLAASLESQMETDRATRARAAPRPPPPAQRPEDAAEIEASSLRILALERQLEELRVAWKSSDERANGLEAKLRQARNDTALAVVRAAAERAEEVARLPEKAVDMLGAGDSRRR